MAVVFNEYMPTIWNDLLSFIGNEYGVAGLMGNLYAESGCKPWACEPSRPQTTCSVYISRVNSGEITRAQFIGGGCSPEGGYISSPKGFGLAQWTSTGRKAGLYDESPVSSVSIADLDRQLSWLRSELSSSYSSTLSVLRSATSVKEASDYVLIHFEAPSAQYQTDYWKDIRAGYGQAIYDRYAGSIPSEYKTISIIIEGNGTVTPPGGSGRNGETVSFLASPRDNDSFIEWEIIAGDVTLTSAYTPNTIATIGNTNSTIKAKFTGQTQNLISITIIVIGRGTVTPVYVEGLTGETFTFVFTPLSSKYKLKRVELADGDADIISQDSEGMEAAIGTVDSIINVYFEYKPFFPGFMLEDEIYKRRLIK